MSDDASGSPQTMGISLLLAIGLLLCFLVAGMVSGFVTLLRMRRQGLLAEDSGPPMTRALLNRPRSLLLTLSISYLLSAGLSVATVPATLGPIARSAGALGWILVWAGALLVLLVGTVLLKALALARPMGYIRSTVWLAWPLFVLLRPLTWLLELLMARLAPTFDALDVSPPLSGGEIRSILAEEETAGLLEDDERSLVSSIFELRDTEIREIMVPRIDMRGLEVETSFAEAEAFATEQPFTRLPVWQENQDNILGILHTKDLLKARSLDVTPTLRQLLRQVYFLPESKGVDEALTEFREKRVHLAVVVDEYGGTAGIVTMEDILEEIVGEIQDEFDQERERIRVVDAHKAVLDPRIDLDDLNEALGLELPTEDSDTLGGFLYALLGKVPSRGDSVEHEGLRFTIDRVERQRMLQVTLQTTSALSGDHVEIPAAEGGAA